MPEETKEQKKRPSPEARYKVELVESEKGLEELNTYSLGEQKRLEKSRPSVPGEKTALNIGVDFDTYRKELENARGNLSERLQEEMKTNERIRDIIGRTFALILRERETGKIVGYAYHRSSGYRTSDDMIYVAPEYRKQGAAQVLREAREETATKFKYPILELKVENMRSRETLLKEGYRKGSEGFRMFKRLKQAAKAKA